MEMERIKKGMKWKKKKMEGVRFKGAGRKSHRQGRKILMIYVLSWKNEKRV